MLGVGRLLEEWGFLKPTDRAKDLPGLLSLGMDRIEKQVGSFKGIAEECQLVFQQRMSPDVNAPYFALRIYTPRTVFVGPMIRRMQKECGDAAGAWVALNLSGPDVLGPRHYVDLVSHVCWMGDSDESCIMEDLREHPEDQAAVYTKAKLTEETAPWIVSPRARPADAPQIRKAVHRFDPQLYRMMVEYIRLRDAYRPSCAPMNLDEAVPMDAVMFLWTHDCRVGDVIDEYFNAEYNAGVSIEWAWALPVTDGIEKAISIMRRCNTYLRAAANIANFIKLKYPA